MNIHFQIEKDRDGVAIFCDEGRVGVITDWYTTSAKVSMYKPLEISRVNKIMQEFESWVTRQAVENHKFVVTLTIRQNAFDGSDVTPQEWLAKTLRRESCICDVRISNYSDTLKSNETEENPFLY